MGGGPSSQQKNAANQQAALASTENQYMTQAQQQQQQARNLAMPFYTQRLNEGLPFMNQMTDFSGGQLAQQFAPARAQILRDTSRYGSNLPSGYRDSLLTNLGSQQARAFDSNMTNNLMMNEQAKMAAAQGIMGQQQLSNPLGWAGQQGQTNESIMNAPLAKPGWGSVLGGVLGAGLGAYTGRPCWMAAAVFGEDFETGPKTALVREYIGRHWPKPVLWFYGKFGQWMATKRALVRLAAPLFETMLRRARRESWEA